MVKQRTLSKQTRNNWLIDALVFSGAMGTSLSGVYFLFFPVGGYQGGRNPLYGVTILFDRTSWDAIHAWSGVIMIIAVVVHFSIHWQWVVSMAKRMMNTIRSMGNCMSKGARLNLIINLIVALSFLITALSGIYFLFAPTGGFQGGRNSGWDTGFIFSRTTWDLIHTWSGVVFILAAVIHFMIHWRWIVNVTTRIIQSLESPYISQTMLENRL